ncbi:hypothetical protein PHISCL_01202 [Aspergillus sclerotialis]|uniref:Uncharacterized protein n=1 Tax=Aspergillus sclerotialis TaxID=2070753 RepID=A0A3A2ZTL5_9EURO|nr:hypothetical protein PHISCL_01202 [Aspergillus sclerotialis]
MNGMAQFQVEKSHLAKFRSTMECLKGTNIKETEDDYGGPESAGAACMSMKIFDDYTLADPALEEVFMNIVRRGQAM